MKVRSKLLLPAIIISFCCVPYANSEGVDHKLSPEIQSPIQDVNDLDALYQTGLGYERGESAEQDLDKAYQHYLIAAEKDYPKAQIALGDLFYKGKGVTQNYSKAFSWYGKAARQNYPAAQFRYGRSFYKGHGAAKDLQQAFKWFELAASAGNASAQHFLAGMYYFGEGVNQNSLSAMEWYQASAKNGHPAAISMLAAIYRQGVIVCPDSEQEMYWYKKGADVGLADHQYKVAMHALEKYDLSKLDDTAVQDELNLLEQAANSGHLDAHVSLTWMSLFKGNYVDAYMWLSLADLLKVNQTRAGVSEYSDTLDGFSQKMTPDELKESKRKIAERLERNALSYKKINFADLDVVEVDFTKLPPRKTDCPVN